MLNFTPATAGAATAQAADAYAAQAATQPLAGFGAGAFLCEGTWAGFRTSTAKTSTAKTSTAKTSTAGTSGVESSILGRVQADGIRLSKVHVDFVQADTDNFIQTARLYPVTPGGVGPNPAREPVPV